MPAIGRVESHTAQSMSNRNGVAPTVDEEIEMVNWSLKAEMPVRSVKLYCLFCPHSPYSLRKIISFTMVSCFITGPITFISYRSLPFLMPRYGRLLTIWMCEPGATRVTCLGQSGTWGLLVSSLGFLAPFATHRSPKALQYTQQISVVQVFVIRQLRHCQKSTLSGQATFWL